MKKIKRKGPGKTADTPAFFMGYRGEAPPPGFLAAWFDREYGGPLTIRFLNQHAASFEACHTSWKAVVQPLLPETDAQHWKAQLGWDHPQLAGIFSAKGAGSEMTDIVLHAARVARGFTMLADGTSFDLITQRFWNPSDWGDCLLGSFQLADHVCVQCDDQQGRTWLYTRGLAKFGLGEYEMYLPRGLPTRPCEELLLELAEVLAGTRKDLKVGERANLHFCARTIRIVRHRTEARWGQPVVFREIVTE